MQKFSDFIVRRHWWIIAFWAVAAVLILGLSPSLTSVESNDQSSFLPSKYESVQAANVAQKLDPKSSGAVDIIVFQNKQHQALTSAEIHQATQVVNTLNADHLDHILSVTLNPAQLSPNHKVQLAQVDYSGNAQDTAVIDSVKTVRDHLSSATSGTDITAGLTGGEATSYDTQDSYNNALKIVSIGTILLIMLLPAIVFRSVISGLLPVVSIGLVYSIATALIADAAKLFDFKVNQQLSILFTVVLFGVGTDYILFFLFRYRERLHSGNKGHETLSFALAHAGEAVLSAALVVISSFVALFFAKFGIFHTFAPGLVICVGTMLLAALTLVPAIVTALGPKVFWPSKSWQQAHADKTTMARRLGSFVGDHPVVTGGTIVIILLALAVGSLSYKADFSSFSQPPAGTQSATAYSAAEKAFPAGILSPTNVYVSSTDHQTLTTSRLAPLTKRLEHASGVSAVLPVVITPNQQTAVYTVVLKANPYSSQAFHVVSTSLHTAAHGIDISGTRVLVGGVTATLVDVQSATNRDLKVVFPIAALFIFIILALLLRSLIAPIFLVLSVGLGFAATLGASVFIFTKVGSDPGLIFFLPILLYVFVVAIGTDYNILTVTRLREEVRAGNAPRKATKLTIEHSSATVVSAGLILACTFASLLLARIGLLTQMGSAIAIGVALAAFIIAPLVIPSISAILGYRIWWPGHRPSEQESND